MIATERLTKRYGKSLALVDLSLEVRQGEVFGLLGPNGSGKTTTIRLLLGLLRPSSGRATVSGFDCWGQSRSVRELVSYLPGELRLIGSMTGKQFLRYLSDLRGGGPLERALAIARERFGLDLDRKVRAYSTGMKQKLALAQVFADPVEVLILDEPTSALDPSARGDVLTLVSEAKALGQTVIFSGHVLSEVEAISDRVAIMRRGRLMHVEDMHARRGLRMLLLRMGGGVAPEPPGSLGLTPRGGDGDAVLFEHRGAAGPLLAWLATQDVADLAIGSEDLRTLYDRFHGPDAVPDEVESK